MTPEEKLMSCVDAFAEAMKKKLKRKEKEGFSGWDNIHCFEGILDEFIKHALWQYKDPKKAREEVDIANLIMMIWNLNHRKEDL